MRKNSPPQEIVTDPVQSAKDAGLRYVTDTSAGIRRMRHGKGFRYVNPDGSALKDRETLARIKSLVIPPAWNEVWICCQPKGHLQATGRDVKGRKQSRYHPRWREVRDETKYERMLIFGVALPEIRQRVEHDLALPGLPRPKVLATVVHLMERTLIRVGNEEYARANQSYGLTTMRDKHVDITGATITFSFKGKSGIRHTIDLQDRRIAKIVQRCQDLPGYELFQYVDSDGTPHAIDSSDVNAYLRDISREEFTAKDFRTWAGTVLACRALQAFEDWKSATEAKKNVAQAVKDVAQRLGNTPSVCRKCYVHPAIIEFYLGGKLKMSRNRSTQNSIGNEAAALRREEDALLKLLRQRRPS